MKKPTNQVHQNDDTKAAVKQELTYSHTNGALPDWVSLTPGRFASKLEVADAGKQWAAATRIGKTLNLAPSQIKALALLSEWEGKTPEDYCRSIVLSLLETSFDDMKVLADDNKRPQEKTWARQFISDVQSVFEKGGTQ